MTTDDKLKYIKTHCFELDACQECELTVGKTCPTKLWGEWTPEEIETAYAILHGEADPDDEVKQADDAINSGLADSGTRREFASGAVRDVAEGKGRCDLLPAVAILRLAKHFERGAVKYSDRNWEKGIPIHSFIDSAIRHTMKYLDGQHDEDHLCAAAWNLICAMWTEEKHPELNDLPWAKGE